MQIEVKQQPDGSFICDPVDLPGSPPIGYGQTWEQAVGNFFVNASQEYFNVGLGIVKGKV